MKAIQMINQMRLVAEKHGVSAKEMEIMINNEPVSMIPAYDEKTKSMVFYTKSFADKNGIKA